MNHNLFLGIDPGLVTTGYALILCESQAAMALESGSIQTDEEAPIERRLLHIEKHLQSVLGRRRPAHAGIEAAFVGRDPGAALKLGQVSGVCLATIARSGLRARAYAPRSIKQTVCGSGSASKADMLRAVRRLVRGAAPETEHEADAFGVALTVATNAGLFKAPARIHAVSF